MAEFENKICVTFALRFLNAARIYKSVSANR
jgi:hypothetical protein